ncbi:MAG: hypothetical protein CL816_03485 [Coxiellaceae bacterium]|nr:hypothetical protein [Coxiellaceae bacterium]|tara:strand:- start:2106 stop:3446 length:1341 start_codon:yes stop_codon:yes gene_type:complete
MDNHKQSDLFIGKERLSKQSHLIEFSQLPKITWAMMQNDLIPRYIGSAIFFLELTSPELEKELNLSDGPSRKYNFLEMSHVETLIEKLHDKDTSDCKLAVIMNCCGHTLTCVFQREEIIDGNDIEIYVNIFNVDSVAFDFDGSDFLKEDFVTLIKHYQTSDNGQFVRLYSTGFIETDEKKSRRQYQDGICASYAIIDSIMMLSVPTITEHMQDPSNHAISLEDIAGVYSVEFLPEHLMLLTQSITGKTSGTYSLQSYLDEMKNNNDLKESKLMLNILLRPQTPRTFFDDISRAQKGISEKEKKEAMQFKDAIISRMPLSASIPSDCNLTEIITHLRLYDSDYKSIIMKMINYILYTSFEKVAHHEPKLKDFIDQVSSEHGIWDVAVDYFDNGPIPSNNQDKLPYDDLDDSRSKSPGAFFFRPVSPTNQQGKDLQAACANGHVKGSL